VVAPSHGWFTPRSTPADALLGAHYSVNDVTLGIGAGGGLTHGYGAPSFRALASVEWAPRPPRPPRVEPSVARVEDVCEHGSTRSADGRCLGDRDGDGVSDAEDACPTIPGERSDDRARNGCTPVAPVPVEADRDKDGIPDALDRCPDMPGTPHEEPSDNGCPLAFVENARIRITEQVEFDPDRAVLDPVSEPVLAAVAEVLAAHPAILRLRVEGHTDNSGDPAHNPPLSDARARAVAAWLVAHGIDAGRLSWVGFGSSKPLLSNDDAIGRRHNRRVEFHIELNSRLPTTDK
jgi:outer membrane protein OmpA-like peptidoglycan-associated protein